MDLLVQLGFVELYQNVSGYLITFLKWFPVWGPIFFWRYFWHEWMHYVQARYKTNMKWVLLEIKIPKEINKTPIAMEIIFNALHQPSTGTWYDKIWKGKVKDWFALEMVSFEGNIKFFIRTTGIYKNVIEAQLYAQYPDIEIFEVPDYTRYVDYRGKDGDWSLIGMDYSLSKPDAYPIKTYVDYGLDKEGAKEEFKTDPLTSIIEYLGTPGKGEQVWIQIIVQAAGSRYHYVDPKTHKHVSGDWKKEGEHLIDAITKRHEKKDDGSSASRMLNMTKGESEVVAAIERNMSKPGFECAIRALYLSKKDKFNPSNIKAIGSLLKPFNTGHLNGFKPIVQTFGLDYWWQDYKDIRVSHYRQAQFEAYKRREWSFEADTPWIANFPSPKPFVISPYKQPFVLSSEELATIFHLPGGVAQTPTFGRISSRKSEAPTNLPI